ELIPYTINEYVMSDKFRRIRCPSKKYPVTVAAPNNAKISPKRASPLIWKSPQLIIKLPSNVINILIIAATENRSPKKKYVPTKANIGCSVTSTTELATDV